MADDGPPGTSGSSSAIASTPDAPLPPLSPRAMCPVCRAPPTDAARAPCGHAGCLKCFLTWGSSRREPKCPMCFAPMLTLRRDADGTDVPITPCARPPSADEAADLAAVDHAFVASEASALLRRVASASRTIYRDAYGSGRRGSGVADACVTALADVECEARSLHSVATSPAPFDAAVVLRRLYSLDEATRTAQAVARAGTAPSPEGGLGGGGGGGSGDGHAYADGEPDHAPPPHIFDLGAALEAARASGGRRRRSR